MSRIKGEMLFVRAAFSPLFSAGSKEKRRGNFGVPDLVGPRPTDLPNPGAIAAEPFSYVFSRLREARRAGASQRPFITQGQEDRKRGGEERRRRRRTHSFLLGEGKWGQKRLKWAVNGNNKEHFERWQEKEGMTSPRASAPASMSAGVAKGAI